MRAGSMVLVNWPQVDSSCLELAPRKARFSYTLVFRATSTTKMIPNLMEISLNYWNFHLTHCQQQKYETLFLNSQSKSRLWFFSHAGNFLFGGAWSSVRRLGAQTKDQECWACRNSSAWTGIGIQVQRFHQPGTDFLSFTRFLVGMIHRRFERRHLNLAMYVTLVSVSSYTLGILIIINQMTT